MSVRQRRHKLAFAVSPRHFVFSPLLRSHISGASVGYDGAEVTIYSVILGLVMSQCYPEVGAPITALRPHSQAQSIKQCCRHKSSASAAQHLLHYQEASGLHIMNVTVLRKVQGQKAGYTIHTARRIALGPMMWYSGPTSLSLKLPRARCPDCPA